jgi:23S rRNA pseudouridine1911/1915/1917 synthase
LQRLIDDQDVLVNGKPAKSSYKLRRDDTIELELIPSPAMRFEPENIPLDIIYEDEELLVVNKPAGLVVHPAAGAYSGTLANALAFHLQNLPQQDGNVRPGIVHRLDKGTSGLMVVAKTERAHESLANQFRERAVFKSYVALVHGTVEQESGRIDQPLARDPRNRTRMAVVRGGRGALTLFRVRRRYDRFTLLDLELKTGRTHQIRVHLAWLKHPVVGDESYSEGRDNNINNPSLAAQVRKMNRQFLHAERLGFRHPKTGKQLRFKAAMPSDLESVLEILEPGGSASGSKIEGG